MSWVRGATEGRGEAGAGLKVGVWAVGGLGCCLRLEGRLEAGVKIHEDVVPAPVLTEAGSGEVVELEAGEALGGARRVGGGLLDVGDGLVVSKAILEGIAETNALPDDEPVVGGHVFDGFGGLAIADVLGVVVVPEGGEGGMVVIPEAVFTGGTVNGLGGSAGVFDAIALIKHIGEADLEENVMLVKISEEFVPVVHHGTREDVAIGTHEVGIHDVVILGVEAANSGGFIPDLLANGRAVGETGEDDGKDEDDDGNDAGGA